MGPDGAGEGNVAGLPGKPLADGAVAGRHDLAHPLAKGGGIGPISLLHGRRRPFRGAGLAPERVPVDPHRAEAGGFRRWRYLSRSEEHTSEIQSLIRLSYSVFCLN